jgi:hypothetical protein
MLVSSDLHNLIPNKPAQPHQQPSIIVGESSKKFELGIVDRELGR